MLNILGGPAAQLAAGLCDDGLDDLIEGCTDGPLAALLEGLGDDVVGQAVDLNIHLDGGDAAAGAADLEVHVAQVVLITEDVGQYGIFVFACILNQSHGDT